MDNSIRIIGQCGKEGKGESQFAQPRGVCINSKTKEIFVVDCNNHRIQVFHLYSLAFVRQIGKGTQGNSPGSLMYPVGIDIADNDYIFVADTNNHRVVIFNHLTGAYVRSIGSQGSSMGCLNCPYGVCVDPSNRQLFVADYENNRIQVFDSETGAAIKVIGEGQGSGPGQFNQPIDVCIDSERDYLLVADYANNRVQVLNKESGEFIRSIGSTEAENAMNGPRALCLNRETALLFVSDRENNRIQMFDKNSFTLIRHIGLGYGISPGMFSRPMELCVDNEEGVLIVVDGYNHRVQIMDLPELRNEKLRIKSAKLTASELMKEISSIAPSSIAISTLVHPESLEWKYSIPGLVFFRIPIYGDHIVCSLTTSLYEDISNHYHAPSTDNVKQIAPILAGISSERESPLFRQAETFLRILDDVTNSTNIIDSSAVCLFAPSLLALYSLMQRGWIPPVSSSETIKRLVSILSYLHKATTMPWERQSLLFTSVELIRVYLQHDVIQVEDIFSSFLQFFEYSYDIEGCFENNQSADGMILDTSAKKSYDQLPASILFAITYLSIISIQSVESWSTGSMIPVNSSREVNIDGLNNSECKEVVSMMLGSAFADLIFSYSKKRKQSGKFSGNIYNSSMSPNNLENCHIHMPRSFSYILKTTLAWKQYQRRILLKQNYDPSTASSLRQSMLFAFAEHIDQIQEVNSLCLHNKENRSRGGRNIWNPSEPLCPGDLVDCMDKEKCWFESLVVEVGIDGSVRIHFLGWGSKWDDTISEGERSVRIAPLNTHTRNWRSDLFEGGLIEIKCNDDMVNQKWMWGRITQLNVDESWVEVAYAFSNEPVVMKKAWLFGETICPVGMHTKDKSKAAASLITKPGKMVKELLAEKVSLGRSDVAFYDILEDVEDFSKLTTMASSHNLRILESFHSKMGMNCANGIYYLPLAAKYLFQCALEEVSSIVAEVVGLFVHSEAIPSSSSAVSDADLNSLIIQLLPVKRMVESMARTSLRDSLPKYFINILYLQAGLSAQSIAHPLKQLSLASANETAVTQVLDLADRLMQLHQLFSLICDQTLTTLVCSPTTKSYIVGKLQATINRCGFTPIANELLTTISNNSAKAHSFFSPFKQNIIVSPHMKRHRNFFRCLVNSGSKQEVEKLYKVMEEEIVHSSLSLISSPLSIWKNGLKANLNNADLQSFMLVNYLRDIITECEGVKSVLDSGWINFQHLLLSPERFLMRKLRKFSAAESLSMGKCLAIAVNYLMSRRKFSSSAEYSPSLATGLLKKIMSLFLTIGYDEIIFYFRQYFAPALFFRIIQGDFSSLVEEKFIWKEIGAITDIAEGIFNQMELFEKLNNEFSKYLLLKLDDSDSNEEFSESSISFETIDINDLLMDVVSEKILHIHLFKDSQIPARVLQDTFSSIRLPSAMRQLIHYFSSFCHGHGIENASRIRWCFGFGKMEVNCSVYHQTCLTLIVNEPQLALLCCLASFCTREEHRLSVGRLAFELNISVEAVIHIVSSMIVCHESIDHQLPIIIRIIEDDNTKQQLSENTVVSLAWTDWLKRNSAMTSASPWTRQNTNANNTQEVNLYDFFWSSNKHAWSANSYWRTSILEASILRQLKNVMINAVAPGAKETLNEMELANIVVRELSERFQGHLFQEDEVLSCAKVLRKKGMISSSLGVSFSSYRSPEVRYSYFTASNADKTEYSRFLQSRRSNIRPNVTPVLSDQDIFDILTPTSSQVVSTTNLGKIDDEVRRASVSPMNEISEGESKYCVSSPQVNKTKYDLMGNSVAAKSISSLIIQKFLLRCFATLSLQDGSLASRKEICLRDYVRTLMDTVATACGSVVTELNDLLSKSLMKTDKDNNIASSEVSKLCIDYCLSQLLAEVSSPFLTPEIPIYPAFLLPLTAGFKCETLQLLLKAFSDIIVSDSTVPDILSKLSNQLLQQSESSSFSLILSLLKKIWHKQYVLNSRRASSLPASRWKTFLLQQLHVTQEHHQKQENNIKSNTLSGIALKEDRETSENKDIESSGNLNESFHSLSSVQSMPSNRQNACSPMLQLSFSSFVGKFLTFISSERLPTSSPLCDPTKTTIPSQSSVMSKNGSTIQKQSLSNTSINKKKPSKILSEMSPAIDRLPHLARQNPSASSFSSFLGNSDDEEGKDSHCSSFPPPLSIPLCPEDSPMRKGVVPPVPPLQRSWIEDPIVRYSQIDLENKLSANFPKSDLCLGQGKDNIITAEFCADSIPSTTLLVDLSDAIPNYSWTTSSKSSSSYSSLLVAPQQNQQHVWNHVISPIVHLISVHAHLIFSIGDGSSFSSNKLKQEDSSSSTNVQIGVALMDSLLCGVLGKCSTTSLDGENERQPYPSLLWWMKRPFSSIFQVIEEGLSLACNLREVSATCEYSNYNYNKRILKIPEWTLPSLSASFGNEDEKYENIALTETFPVGYCCNNDAWDSLVTLQILDVNSSFVSIVTQVSNVLCVHWSTAAVYLSLFDWEAQNLLENITSNDNGIVSDEENFRAFSGTVYHLLTISKSVGNCTLICFSCGNSMILEEMFSLGCHHFACRHCWWKFIDQKIIEFEKMEPSSSKDIKKWLIPCQRSCCSSNSCHFFGGLELIFAITENGRLKKTESFDVSTCNTYLSFLYKVVALDFAQNQQRKKQLYPSVACAHYHYVSTSDRDTLQCLVCDGSSIASDLEEHKNMYNRGTDKSKHLFNTRYSPFRNQRTQFTASHTNVRKLADITSMPMLSHSSHLRRIQQHLDIFHKRLSVCSDLVQFGAYQRRIRFWRLFWDCQLLLDHNQSMSMIDLDLLRHVKDLLYKKVALVCDERDPITVSKIGDKQFDTFENIKEVTADVSEDTLLLMSQLRKKLKQLYDFPDICSSRLVLAPSAKANTVANLPSYARGLQSSLTRNHSSRSNNYTVSVRYNGDVFPWPIRVAAKESSSTEKNTISAADHIESGNVVIVESSALSLVATELNQYVSPSIADKKEHCKADAANFSLELNHLHQSFASIDNSTLRFHLSKLFDSIEVCPSRYFEPSNYEVCDSQDEENQKQRQWQQLVDLIQYPKHDASSLFLTLHIVTLFVEQQQHQQGNSLQKSIHPQGNNFLVTEDLLVCLYDLLQQHQQITIHSASAVDNDASHNDLTDERHEKNHSTWMSLSYEQSARLVRQCGKLLCAMASSSIFLLQSSSVDTVSLVFEACVQLLYLEHRVDELYRVIGHIAIAVIDLTLCSNHSHLNNVSSIHNHLPDSNVLAARVIERNSDNNRDSSNEYVDSIHTKTDLHVIDFIDALVSRYEDLQVLEGARRERRFLEEENVTGENNEHVYFAEIYHLGDLLCAVLLRVLSVPGEGKRNEGSKLDNCLQISKTDNPEMIEAIYALPGIFSLLFLTLEHYTKILLHHETSNSNIVDSFDKSSYDYFYNRIYRQCASFPVHDNYNRQGPGMKLCLLLHITRLLLGQADMNRHLIVWSPFFDRLAMILRDLCQYFLRPTVRSTHNGSSSTAIVNSLMPIIVTTGEFPLFVVTMRCVSEISESCEVFRRCLLKHDLSYLLLYLQTAWASLHRNHHINDQHRIREVTSIDISEEEEIELENAKELELQKQDALLQLQRAIAVVCEGGSLLAADSSSAASCSAGASISPPLPTMLHHIQRPIQTAFFDGRVTNNNNNNSHIDAHHLQHRNEEDMEMLAGFVQRFESFFTQNNDAGANHRRDGNNDDVANMMEPPPVVERLVNRDMFNINDILARIAQQEAREDADEDSGSDMESGVLDEGFDEANEEDLEFNMALWQQHFREHFMHHDQDQRLFDPDGELEEEDEEQENVSTVDEIHFEEDDMTEEDDDGGDELSDNVFENEEDGDEHSLDL